MNLNRLNLIILTTLAAGVFTGCSSLKVLQPKEDLSRYYYLESLPEKGPESVPDKGLTLMVGPTSVARYLDQPQIATFAQPNRIRYSALNIWAEPLEDNINRLLVDRLSNELEAARTGVAGIINEGTWDYRVGYHIDRLGGEPGKTARLQVSWWIDSREENRLSFENVRYEQPIPGKEDDFEAYVKAMQTLIERWATDVATRIQQLEDGTASSEEAAPPA